MTESQIDFDKLQLLVLDVDGVLTDGRIVLTDSGDEMKSFNAHDGAGMKYWRRVGKKLAMVSGRPSQAASKRAQELGVDCVHLNAKDKLPVYLEVLAELGVTDEHTAVIGDDLTDIPMLIRCAFPVAVAGAAEETKAVAAYVTKADGGAGAVREVIELILKEAGLWGSVLSRYLNSAEKHR